MRKKILEGMMRPRGYASAWFEWESLHYICYPIGIHLIARYARALYGWIAYLRSDDMYTCPRCGGVPIPQRRGHHHVHW